VLPRFWSVWWSRCVLVLLRLRLRHYIPLLASHSTPRQHQPAVVGPGLSWLVVGGDGGDLGCRGERRTRWLAVAVFPSVWIREGFADEPRTTHCMPVVCCVLCRNLQGAIFTFVYLEVIAPDSVTNWFNRAHGRVRSDPQCVRLLGGGTIKAYGEETWSRWARNRPIA